MEKLCIGIGLVILGFISISTQRIVDAIWLIGDLRAGSGFNSAIAFGLAAIVLGLVLCIIGLIQQKKH